MRKAAVLTLLALALALPSVADDRHQSYISYDDGGTVVRTGEDGKEVEAHRNFPIYPGDQIITARRGRTEVRLSDGNVIGIDRTSVLTFRSILDSYDGEDNETIAELKSGKVAIHRTDVGRDHVRLDTDNASYVAYNESIYSVETDARGRDRVTVFEGSVEVRTPRRSTRLRSGESAAVDNDGAYDLIGDQRDSADEFERWFLGRSERFDNRSTRYVDRRLSYWNDDLDDYGRWVNVSGIGWSWRPYVSVGWRPYYHGYWSHRRGCLTWISYDPWGWGPYHYGRWAYDPGYGWVWVPGYGYSPAWVYWWYGPSYIGWAPAGWWDCHRGYYDWAYRPYRNRDFGFGFYGRVRVSDLDLRPWTFLDSRTIVSRRVDRAALTTDAIKQRLGRGNGGYATIGSGPARFTNEELPDPADAIRRRGLDGRYTGRETGAPPTDLTPFFRRDADVSGSVRDRIVRSRGGSGSTVTVGGTVTRGSGGATGGPAPIDGSTGVAPIGRGGVSPIGGGNAGSTPSTGGSTDSRRGGGINRGGSGSAPSTGGRSAETTPRDAGSWRDRIGRGTTPSDPTTREGNGTDVTPRDGATRDGGSWRGRIGDRGTAVTPRDSAPSTGSTPDAPRSGDPWRGRPRTDDATSRDSGSPSTREDSGSNDVPRRVIDRIGGARIYPRDDSGSSSSTRRRDSGSSSGSRDAYRRPQSDSGSSSRDSGSSSRSNDSGRSRDSGSSSRSNDSGRSRDSGSSSRSNDSGSRGDSGNRGDGGHIKRDQ